ncbi:MAG: caspase domain-containing protein [Capsulimonadaceae bacterium]
MRRMRYCFLLTCLTLSFWGSPWPVSAAGGSHTKYAVIVGVDKYALEINNLQYAGSDAQSVAGALTDPSVGGFDPRNVFTLVSENDDPSMWPTRANILRELHSVARLTHNGDQIWFFFSGHGFDFDQKSYLCPSDAQVSDLDTMIRVQDLRDLLIQECAPKADRIVILDACHSGSTRDLVVTREAVFEAPHVVTIASSDVDESSWEFPDVGGVFTYYLVRGLRGEACSHHAVVTASDLVRYIVPKVSAEVRNREPMAHQTPQSVPRQVETSWAKDLPLATPSSVAPATLPQDLVEQVPLGPPVAVALNETRVYHDQRFSSEIAETALKSALVVKGYPVIDKEAIDFLHSQDDPQEAALRARRKNARYVVLGTAETSANDIVPPFVTVTATISFKLVDETGAVLLSTNVSSDPVAGGTELKAATEALEDAAAAAADQLLQQLSTIRKHPGGQP